MNIKMRMIEIEWILHLWSACIIIIIIINYYHSCSLVGIEMDNGKHAFGGFRKLEADQNDICWIIILNNNLSSVQVSELYMNSFPIRDFWLH